MVFRTSISYLSRLESLAIATRKMPNGKRKSGFCRSEDAKTAMARSISPKIPTQLFDQKNIHSPSETHDRRIFGEQDLQAKRRSIRPAASWREGAMWGHSFPKCAVCGRFLQPMLGGSRIVYYLCMLETCGKRHALPFTQTT